MSEKRQRKRYNIRDEAPIDFIYDFEASVDVVEKDHGAESAKHRALAKNVSAEGLCFQSDHQLKIGQLLDLDYYVPGDAKPIHMKVMVRWSKQEGIDYNTGVLVKYIEGEPVDQSIYYDNEYHVYWSNVLESVIGKFRINEQKKRESIE